MFCFLFFSYLDFLPLSTFRTNYAGDLNARPFDPHRDPFAFSSSESNKIVPVVKAAPTEVTPVQTIVSRQFSPVIPSRVLGDLVVESYQSLVESVPSRQLTAVNNRGSYSPSPTNSSPTHRVFIRYSPVGASFTSAESAMSTPSIAQSVCETGEPTAQTLSAMPGDSTVRSVRTVSENELVRSVSVMSAVLVARAVSAVSTESIARSVSVISAESVTRSLSPMSDGCVEQLIVSRSSGALTGTSVSTICKFMFSFTTKKSFKQNLICGNWM